MTDSFEDFSEVNRFGTTYIVWRIESEAFYDGYYFAMGFGSTGCKGIFCSDVACSALTGEGCRYPWKARPGMHAVGFDVYKMATRVGWTIRPVGPSSDPSDRPYPTHFGLVLIS